MVLYLLAVDNCTLNFFPSCSVHYLRILLSEGLVEEAMQFIATSKMEVRMYVCANLKFLIQCIDISY